MKLIEKIKVEPFKYLILVGTVLLFFVITFREGLLTKVKIDEKISDINQNELLVFVQDGCPHCAHAEDFLNNNKFDGVKVVYHNLNNKTSLGLLFQYIAKLSIPQKDLGTPLFIFNDEYIMGFSEEEKNSLINLITNRKSEEKHQLSEVDLGFLGKYNLLNTSIPILAVVIGLADGFNPCAMWVLVYLISICATINDKRKIILLVGSFVLSSGILYFLFMTAWLNVFLYIGYIRILAVAIGSFAMYFGMLSIYEYIKSGGFIQCKLQDNETRKESMNKIQKLVRAELSLVSVFGIVCLAFVVNSIEFACSAALPATFTFVLTQAGLSTFEYYFYILVYTIFFMLDDMIIFGLAVFAINKYTGTKYEKYSTLIGGIVMLIIGIFITFFPKALS
ncbi:MAG TPA: hypothetical protein VLL98_04685 [Rickettsiales bacterium]|nr:hypothetical protein [Rickettsiales bacterium]